MRMVPSAIWRTNSSAERIVFNLLSQIDLGSGATAFHSLNLSEHAYKLSGEADFVIVAPMVLLVLEIKGGRVACHDGIWEYTDRFGQAHRNSEGPFKQSQSAMYALRERLRLSFPAMNVNRLPFGYGVLLPQTDFDVRSVEWPDPVVADAKDLRTPADMRRTLKVMVDYWRGKVNGCPDFSEADVREIRNLLRPSFDTVPSLKAQLDLIDVNMERLTAEQYERLDMIEQNPRITCEGGAGTGKTFLAAEIARRHAATGLSTLFVCRNPRLSRFLGERLSQYGVEVRSFAEVRESCKEQFDVLIVDEAQDTMTIDALAVFDAAVRRGLERGTWRFFLDPNNQAGIYGEYDPEAYSLVKSLATHAKLTRNCRNTEEIVTDIRLLTGADLGVSIAGSGPRVRLEYAHGKEDEAGKLRVHLEKLEASHIPRSDVTLLSFAEMEYSCVTLLPERLRKLIQKPAEASFLKRKDDVIEYSTIADFKGLESLYVCLIDVEAPADSDLDVKSLYVGMSRAKAGLWMILPEQMRSAIRRTTKENMLCPA